MFQLLAASVDSPQWFLGSVLGRRRAVSAPNLAPISRSCWWLWIRRPVSSSWISSRNGGARGAVPGLLVGAGGLGSGGVPDLRGLRRAPFARRLLPRRPVPPRPIRLRGNQLLLAGSFFGSEMAVPSCAIPVSRIVVCNGRDELHSFRLTWFRTAGSGAGHGSVSLNHIIQEVCFAFTFYVVQDMIIPNSR